jgi:hypothetical protein
MRKIEGRWGEYYGMTIWTKIRVGECKPECCGLHVVPMFIAPQRPLTLPVVALRVSLAYRQSWEDEYFYDPGKKPEKWYPCTFTRESPLPLGHINEPNVIFKDDPEDFVQERLEECGKQAAEKAIEEVF